MAGSIPDLLRLAWLPESPVATTSRVKAVVVKWKNLFPWKLCSNSPHSYVGDLCRIVHAKLVNLNHLFGNEFGHRIIAINQAKRTQGKIERPVQQLDFIRVKLAAPQQPIDWHSPTPSARKNHPRLDFYPVRNKKK
jgi:hypothetical protein